MDFIKRHMEDSMGGDTSDSSGGDAMSDALNATGVDFSDPDQASDFLEKMLDDTEFQVVGNAYARAFWYGVVVLIAIAAISNLIHRHVRKFRLRAAAKDRPQPAKPTNILTRCVATVTALIRELSYPQLTPVRFTRWLKIPPVGTILLLLVYLAFILALEFHNNNIPGAQHYTALGIRAGWLAVAQIPLLILLAGKNNLIGLVTGLSYERLNVLHRWVSRVLLLLATLHVGYQNYGWNQYGLRQLEWSTDSCPPTGIATYAILLWMNLSTLAPIRNLSYEFFVVQHLITFFGFIVAIMLHLPSTALYSRVYIYIPIGIYLLDRLIRTSRYAVNNARPGRTTLTPLEGAVTKIRLHSKQIKKWTPGAHVLLSIPKFGLGQSHPATIASTPSSHEGDLVFILKGHKGFTKRIMTSANNSLTSLLPRTKQEASASQQETRIALVDGPYGGSQADFAAFDTVLLIAGSTGVTFTLSILLDIAHRAATTKKLPVRRLQFVWIVKKTSWTAWVSEELVSAFGKLKASGIDVDIKIFVTCDDAFTDQSDDPKECGCKCDKSLGPCCCTTIDDEDADGHDNDDHTPAAIDRMTSSEEKSQVPITSNIIQEKPKTPTIISPSRDLTSPPSSLRSCATYTSGRPPLRDMLWELLQQAEGETGIAVCGPLGLSSTVRNHVAGISNERAVHKGTGAQGVYLHVEGFCW